MLVAAVMKADLTDDLLQPSKRRNKSNLGARRPRTSTSVSPGGPEDVDIELYDSGLGMRQTVGQFQLMSMAQGGAARPSTAIHRAAA